MLFLLITAVSTEIAGGCKLAELVSDHIFSDVHGNMTAAVMNSDGVSDEGREDGGRTGPGLDDLLGAGLVHLIDSLQQLGSGEGAFLNASAHLRSLLTLRCGA